MCICTHTHARTHARIGDKSNARRHTQTFEARKSGAPSDDLSAGIAAHMAALSHEFVGSLFVTVAVHGKEGDSLRHSLSVCACVRARAHVCVCVCVCVYVCDCVFSVQNIFSKAYLKYKYICKKISTYVST